jgi:hypothetical protein
MRSRSNLQIEKNDAIAVCPAGIEDFCMPVYERISAVVSLTLIGLALYFVLEFPRQVASFTLLDSPLALISPRQWLMTFLLAGLAMAGADAVIRSHPTLTDLRTAYLATFWTLPGLLVITATQTLGLAPNTVAWAVGLVGVGLLLWLTILAEYRQVSPDATLRWPRLWQQLVGFGVALPLFVVIYYTRSRSALSATGIMLVSGMVGLALLRYSSKSLFKTWLFAAVIGLSLGQVTWALNYWRIGALQAGLILLLVLYVLLGLAQQQLLGSLSRRALVEFGAVALVALAVILNL